VRNARRPAKGGYERALQTGLMLCNCGYARDRLPDPDVEQRTSHGPASSRPKVAGGWALAAYELAENLVEQAAQVN
jgi:hypothetical protein